MTPELQRLIESHDRLIMPLARKYARPGLDIDDLVQEGRLALWKNAKKWDATRATFATFAHLVIETRLRRLAMRHAGREGRLINESIDGENALTVGQIATVGPDDHDDTLPIVREVLSERLANVFIRSAGLDGDPSETSAEIARRTGKAEGRIAAEIELAKRLLRVACIERGLDPVTAA